MTQQQYIIKRKLNIIELSEQLCNISEACRRLGVSRQHYYDNKAAPEPFINFDIYDSRPVQFLKKRIMGGKNGRLHM